MTTPYPDRLSANVENALTAPETILLLEKAPEIYERFIKVKQAGWRHQRRLAWADRGYVTQGASIIGAGAIIAVFFVGRLADRG